MLRELWNTANIEEALIQQMEYAKPNRGLYIFLDEKIYDESELTESFLANRTSFVSKKSEVNPLLEDKIKQVGIYGFAISGNKQIYSVRGLNSVYSKLFTIANVKDFLSSKKEIDKAQNFYTNGFSESYIQKSLQKAFALSGTKNDRQAIIEKKKQLINQVLNNYQPTIDSMSEQAPKTLAIIQQNKHFIEAIIQHFETEYPSEIKTIRLNIIVSNECDLTTLKDESYLYFSYSLFAGTPGIYHNQTAYFYSAISANHNESKKMMYLNRTDAPNIGHDMLSEQKLDKNISLYLFIRALAQSTKNPIKTFYVKDNQLLLTPSIGSLRYKVLEDKKAYFITECSILNEWNPKGYRPLDFSFNYYNNKINVTDYQQLANIIFFGSKEKHVPNQLYVNKEKKDDNSTIKNKYFEGNKLSPESEKIYNLIKSVGAFDQSTDVLYSIFFNLRKDLLLNSRYETLSKSESLDIYANMTNFWDSLIQYHRPTMPKNIDLRCIHNDEEYLVALVQLHLRLFDAVITHTQSNTLDNSSKLINQLIKKTRYSLLLNSLIQYKEQYQFVFIELEQDYINQKQKAMDLQQTEANSIDPNLRKALQKKYKTMTKSEMIADKEYFACCIKHLKKYQPKQAVIPNQEDIIYALLQQNVSIKYKTSKENTHDNEKK